MSNFFDIKGGAVTPRNNPQVSRDICKWVQSGAFIGPTDSVTPPVLPDTAKYLELGPLALSGDFTVVFWYYTQDLPTTGKAIPIFQWGSGSDGSEGMALVHEADAAGTLSLLARGSKISVTGAAAQTHMHVFVQRSEGETKVGIGGVAWSAALTTVPADATARLFIVGAGSVSNTTAVSIYIEEFRVTKSAYVGTISTPPLWNAVSDYDIRVSWGSILAFVSMSPATFTNTTLHLPFTGVHGGVSFPDKSYKHAPVTLYNAGTYVRTVTDVTSPRRSSVCWFPGAGSRLDLSVDLSGSADIEISGWFILVNGGKGSSWSRIFHLGTGNNYGALDLVTIGGENPTHVFASIWTPGEVWFGQTPGTLANLTWHHFVVIRNNWTWYLVINGVNLSGSGFYWPVDLTQTSFHIGGSPNTEWYNGFMSDFLIRRSVSVDPDHYVVPTTPSDVFTEVFTRPGLPLASYGGKCIPIDGYKPRWGKPVESVTALVPRVVQERGSYAISDYVSRVGEMGSYRVRLYDRDSGLLVASTRSAADGSYVFSNLPNRPEEYTLVAIDNDPKIDALNAAVADLITPEIP